MLLSLLSSEQLNTCISWEGGGGVIFFSRGIWKEMERVHLVYVHVTLLCEFQIKVKIFHGGLGASQLTTFLIPL